MAEITGFKYEVKFHEPFMCGSFFWVSNRY